MSKLDGAEKRLKELLGATEQMNVTKRYVASEALKLAVVNVGGSSKLAEKLGTTRQVVNNWKSRGAPVEHCERISEVSGVSFGLLAPGAERKKLAPASVSEAGGR